MHAGRLRKCLQSLKDCLWGGGKWEREGCNDSTQDRAKDKSLPNLDGTVRHHPRGQVLPRSVPPPDLSMAQALFLMPLPERLSSLPSPAISVPPLCYMKPHESFKGSQ